MDEILAIRLRSKINCTLTPKIFEVGSSWIDKKVFGCWAGELGLQ